MKRRLSSLASKEYDVLIVGGGIFGACALWDAASRGLSAALVEKGDFTCATSANSLKMIHGGIRYLQHVDLPRIRYSVQERRALLRIAPHLVHPLPTVIPTYGHGLKGKEVLRAGFLFYDLVSLDRNWGISDPEKKIPNGSFISREEVLELFPALDKNGLTGAAIFNDAQMYNPPRLALSIIKSAVMAGAEIANYIEAKSLIKSKNRVSGVKAVDVLTGDELEIRGKVVLNTAGPWAEELLRSADIQIAPRRTFSRDAFFIVPRPLTGKYAIAVQARTKDPGALLSRKERHLFIAPWRGEYTLIGVWHIVHKGKAGDFSVSKEELKGFISEINEAYPALELGINDVSMWNAGLVLSGDNVEGAANIRYGKRSKIFDHTEDGVDGIVTLIGSRFTTARGDTSKAIDLVFKKLGKKAPSSTTDVTPIYGGDFKRFDKLFDSASKQCTHKLSGEVLHALLRNYGSKYNDVLRYAEKTPSLAGTIENSKVIKAEVVNAVRNEMAQRLEDVALRRTDLATGKYPGDNALQVCGDLMGLEHKWSKGRVQKEINDVKDILRRVCVS